MANLELEDAKKRVAKGLSAKTEILEIENAISLRQIELSNVKNRITQAQNQIFTLLSVSAVSHPNLLFKTIDEPDIYSLNPPKLEEAIKKALAYWPDFQIAKDRVETERLRLDYAKNQTKPKIDIVASLGSYNLSNSSRPVLGKLFSNDHHPWYLGLEYAIPINNTMAKANKRVQQLRLEQTHIEFSNLHTSLDNSIKDRIDEFKSLLIQFQQYERGLEIKTQLLTAMKEKMKFGRIGIRELFDEQEKMIDFQRKHLSALVELKLAQAALEKATGVLLVNFGIDLSQESTPLSLPENLYEGEILK